MFLICSYVCYVSLTIAAQVHACLDHEGSARGGAGACMRTWPLPLAVRKGQYEKIGHSYSRVIPPSWVGAQLGFHTDAKKNLFASLAPLWQVACTHVQVCSYNLLFSMFLCSMFLCSYVQVYSYVRTHMLWHTYVRLNGSLLGGFCIAASLCVGTHGGGRPL